MTVAAARLSVFSMMSDQQLLVAVQDLQTRIAQFAFARGPISSKLRDCYLDSRDAAVAELERRRT